MKMHLRFWMMAAIGFSALAAVGCSSSEKKDDPAPTYKYPDQAAFCAGLGAAVCNTQVLDACVVDKDICKANMQGWACQDYKGVYRKEVAEDCVKAWEDAYADAKLMGTEQANIDKVCEKVFGGSGGTGAACTSLRDCDLDENLQCVKGKCEIPKNVTAGEDCSADDSQCVTGYYCTANDKICGKRAALAAECTETKPCMEELRCVVATAGTPGTCQEKTANNLPCTDKSECMGGLCIQIPGGDAGVAYACSQQWQITTWDPFCAKTKNF